MKKFITLPATIIVLALLFTLYSCKKSSCWTLVDCMGNDLSQYCGSENEVKAYCASIGTPGCAVSYRK